MSVELLDKAANDIFETKTLPGTEGILIEILDPSLKVAAYTMFNPKMEFIHIA